MGSKIIFEIGSSSKNHKTCSRGHTFYKSSDCPACRVCWPGYYRTRSPSDLPKKLAAPALRALLQGKIMTLSQLSQKYTEAEILELHGMGPKAIGLLKAAIRKRGLSLRKIGSRRWNA